MTGFDWALSGMFGASALCWGLSLVFREHGWIDRIWSVAPPIYSVYFAYAAGFELRTAVMAGLAGLWGVRLTYNFWRKGGYRLGGEDYRWQVLRGEMNPILFAVFNIFYICLAQNAVLFGLALPAWFAANATRPWNGLDLLATVLFLSFLAGEVVADEQQWRFHEDKRKRREQGLPIEKGFLDRGLFRFSRHPNFFCEMGLWWAFYLFSVAAGAGTVNWSVLGVLVLTLQFQGSTSMTEKLSAQKYPEYADYQRTTSRLIPLPPRG